MAVPNGPLGQPDPWPLPGWLTDETFFSLASRYHVMAGNRLPEHTSLALFGRKRWGYQQDFPGPLGVFAERTAGQLGSAEEIAQARTVLPFYLSARTAAVSREAYQALTQGQTGSLKFRLGLLTSRFRAHHPLKACPGCMQDDVASHGWAYWHRHHQLPGVWTCCHHVLPLQASSLKSTGVGRFTWLVPDTAALAPTAVADAGHASLRALMRFSDLVAGWTSLMASTLNSAVLARTYQGRIAHLKPGKHREDLAKAYCDAIAALRVAPDLSALPAQPAQAVHSINRWVFAPGEATHPLRHLSFIYWLFSSWEDFQESYAHAARAEASPPVPTTGAQVVQPSDARKVLVVSGLTEGRSISSLARKLGITVQTAQSWAAAAGLATPRRAKYLKNERYNALVEDLRQGSDKAELAKAHGISVQTVTRVLRTEPGLSEIWHQIRHQRAQHEARTQWQRAVSECRHLGVQQARSLAPAAYAWLYRNDRAWLQAVSQAVSPARPDQGPRVNWDQRDIALAHSVQRAAAELFKKHNGGSGQIRLGELCQLVPELKAKLRALDRLPLTRQAIQSVTKKGRRLAVTTTGLSI
jgi:transposase